MHDTIVAAVWSRMAVASIYFENISPINKMYLNPSVSVGSVAMSIETNCIGASGITIGNSGALPGLLSTLHLPHGSQLAIKCFT